MLRGHSEVFVPLAMLAPDTHHCSLDWTRIHVSGGGEETYPLRAMAPPPTVCSIVRMGRVVVSNPPRAVEVGDDVTLSELASLH